MPYKSLLKLPDSVKNHLPEHAQEIYQAAFNNAWDGYKHPQGRDGEDTRESTAHRVAWSAVKKKYRKDGETWKPK